MTRYADLGRVRSDAIPAPAAAAGSRLSIARRSLLDLPISISTGTLAGAGISAPPSGTTPSGPVAGMTEQAGDSDAIRRGGGSDEIGMEAESDLNATFDVPAFLRRQES
jgi:hypothetical protein